jgi:divalent metal cation (Fe/Co/Zn/Cd) transporter
MRRRRLRDREDHRPASAATRSDARRPRGAVGFAGNEIATQVRLSAGRRLDSPALVADGYDARTDGLVSLGVLLSALVALGLPIADPMIAIAITAVILRITWQSWLTVSGRAQSH